jgi:hypothetical protein
MSRVTNRSLYDTDIAEPEGLSELLVEIFEPNQGSMYKLVDIIDRANAPPVFIYTEYRSKDNELTNFSYSGGDGLGTIHQMGSRQILDLGARPIGELERGKILSAFCKIEFCLDVLVCIAIGVYDTKVAWPDVKKQLREFDGIYFTVESRLKFLHRSEIIRKKTKSAVIKTRKIRDVLAHQYMPQSDMGLEGGNYRCLAKSS